MLLFFYVKLAAKYNVSILATGGDHGYGTTFGGLQNGLEIDLGHFKTVDVDAGSNTMTIGGAVTFVEVFDPLYNAGKEVRKFFLCGKLVCCIGADFNLPEMSTCSCVGMGRHSWCSCGPLPRPSRFDPRCPTFCATGDCHRRYHHRLCYRAFGSLLGAAWSRPQFGHRCFCDQEAVGLSGSVRVRERIADFVN